MSLEEIQTIDAIDDPIWEELDRKREEYIRILKIVFYVKIMYYMKQEVSFYIMMMFL